MTTIVLFLIIFDGIFYKQVNIYCKILILCVLTLVFCNFHIALIGCNFDITFKL